MMIDTPPRGLAREADTALTLSVPCSACGNPVTLIYQRGETYRTVDWACPWDNCHAVQSFEIKGSVVRVVARRGAS
jgi:hypothetical protein